MVRFDWYQNGTHVYVTVYVKNVAAEDVELRATATEVHVHTPAQDVAFAPLYAEIGAATRHVRAANIEIQLAKRTPHEQWPSLTRAPAHAAPRTSAQSKWDAIADEAEETVPAGTDAGLNAFFQKLYADADDDTRRAMMKSFQESNGTTLSTNWAEIGKQRTATRAPAGMVPKNYQD
ncbi:Cochaperone protein [Malassezia vespertilionis]|uniref:Sgt1p n=1 Tax=Malassezia vespertilionis TaxID=2020962 RepID=A0A2N1JE91_9BASI|nr:Cochaperone protein [Malassezia vespertilionis]PKI84852.1 hypothetical protein MVES_001272 [Malassezia vespertilionis]WFD06018.1 Cochaperone protein [Malassezia vespertilionis]